MKVSRLALIEEYVVKHGNATLPELAETFGVSLNTVRRDVAELSDRGRIQKVYGGVTANVPPIMPVSVREATNSREKEHIGQLAAKLVCDGDTIFLDSGSTTPYLLRYLSGKRDVTVISHNLKVMDEASKLEGIHLIALGGEYNPRTNDFSGLASSAGLLAGYHISKVFLAATAVSAHFGLANTSFLEAEMKRRLVGVGDYIVLMADHSKFSKNGAITFCELGALDALVTDRRPEDAFVDACREREISLYY